MKETNRAKSVRHEESNKNAIVLNSSHQLKIPEHILNRNRSAHEINVKTKEAKNFSKSGVEMVDVMDTLQHVISISEKEMAKTCTFLQKGTNTRNTDNSMVTLIKSKTSMSIAFSKQCQ